MRLYARAGFDLRPCVSLAGIPRFVPEWPAPVRGARPEDFGWIDEVARGREARATRRTCVRSSVAARRSTSSRAAPGWRGSRPASSSWPPTDDQAAALLLQAYLAGLPRGKQAEVEPIPAGHDWAVRIGLDAGLVLSPAGPVFTRGDLGHLAPYLPNGGYL